MLRKETIAMHIKETVAIAFHSMRIGRLRTVLTMLSITITVSVVIVMSGLAYGITSMYGGVFDTLARGISITSGSPSIPGGNGRQSLSDDDVADLRVKSDPAIISGIVPIVGGQVMMRRGTQEYLANVVGASAAFLSLEHLVVTDGVIFTDKQYRENARVIVIGPSLVRALFAGNNSAAIGSDVRLGRATFRVIGTLSRDGQGDVMAVMPMTTARTFLFGGMRTVGEIGVLATSLAELTAAVEQVHGILDTAHFVKSPAHRDYSVEYFAQAITLIPQVMGMLVWFTKATTVLALFVGVVGLANIMLITVTARTYEIGVRRAIGARRGAILRQFLVESVVIAGFGGLLGVALGVFLIAAGRLLLPRVLPIYGVPQVFVTDVLLAFGLSLVVGLVAGSYPAIRAARLHPWHALCR
ncbi:ABC transporter permease [Pseudonocardia sp.]|uniref:ABC transporter permease n=1 Tax=Pseudonocardia sp. TaxID=60912 RepID=UPI002D7F7E8B|nr:ABC transporter permease [Pseudonocardia sp.]